MVLPDSTSNGRPGVLEHEHALDVVAFELFAGDGVEERSLDTEEGHGGRAGLALNGTRERRDDDGTGLSLEEGIDDGSLLAADVVVQPVPCLGVDGLADGADDTEGAEVCLLHVRLTETTEETDGSGSGVEVGDAVLVDGLPEARWGGVDGSRLEHGGGDTVSERTVDNVASSNGSIRLAH